jgi:hypothetical protein
VPLTRDEIRLGYLYAFGREPESEDAYKRYASFKDVIALRNLLFESEEGQDKIRQLRKKKGGHLIQTFERPAFCFIHMEKTGGTTFHYAIKDHFAPDRVSSPHIFELGSLPLQELASYDLVSGHFDYFTSSFIPRRLVLRASLFRDPVERLISLYRFLRSHPAYMRQGHVYMDLAGRLGPEDFFRQPQVLASPRFNNAYYRTFGTTLFGAVDEAQDKRDLRTNAELAIKRIRGLVGIGLTHRMKESIDSILRQLVLPPPRAFETRHQTDEFAKSVKGFVAVPPVEVTPQLTRALAPLVAVDTELYRVATEEFEKRLSNPRIEAERQSGA